MSKLGQQVAHHFQHTAVVVNHNGAPVPLWLSGLVAVVAAGLAIMVWRERPR